MLNLYSISTKSEIKSGLSGGEISAIFYHDIFDYPLNFADLIRWKASEKFQTSHSIRFQILQKNGYLFIEGREGLIYQRILRKRISDKKFEIARTASKVLSLLPTIKMVAVTGSLAMENSTEGSDIDLMVVTKKGTLWTTRLFAYLLIGLFGIRVRRVGKRGERDRLCLNIWMDENDLVWRKDRNAYTAHEIGQILPFVNKDKTYEKLIWKNRWIKKFWPNSVKIVNSELRIKNHARNPLYVIPNALYWLLEKLAYELQLSYMKSKITRETVTPTRALFHPQDWAKIVLSRLSS